MFSLKPSLRTLCCLSFIMQLHCLYALQDTPTQLTGSPELSACSLLFQYENKRCATWDDAGESVFLMYSNEANDQHPYTHETTSALQWMPNQLNIVHDATACEYARFTQAYPVNGISTGKEQILRTRNHTIAASEYTLRLIQCRTSSANHEHKIMLHSNRNPREKIYAAYAAADLNGFPLIVRAYQDESLIHYAYFGTSKTSGMFSFRHKKYCNIKQLTFATQHDPSEEIMLGVLRSDKQNTAYRLSFVRIALNSQGTIIACMPETGYSVTAPQDTLNNDKIMDCSLGFNNKGTLCALAVRMAHKPDDEAQQHTYACRISCYDPITQKVCTDLPEICAEYQDNQPRIHLTAISTVQPNNDGSRFIFGNVLIQRASTPALPSIHQHASEQSQNTARFLSSSSDATEYEEEQILSSPYPCSPTPLVTLSSPLSNDKQELSSSSNPDPMETDNTMHDIEPLDDEDRWWDEALGENP